MKEVFIYLLTILAGLVILGYSMHMLVGGLVSETAEYMIIAITCLLGALVIAYMAWDVIRHRRGKWR